MRHRHGRIVAPCRQKSVGRGRSEICGRGTGVAAELNASCPAGSAGPSCGRKSGRLISRSSPAARVKPCPRREAEYGDPGSAGRTRRGGRRARGRTLKDWGLSGLAIFAVCDSYLAERPAIQTVADLQGHKPRLVGLYPDMILNARVDYHRHALGMTRRVAAWPSNFWCQCWSIT